MGNQANYLLTKSAILADFYISGFRYYDGSEVFSHLQIGTPLQLCTKQENRHDEYAVEIYYCHVDKFFKLGYVPRKKNVSFRCICKRFRIE